MDYTKKIFKGSAIVVGGRMLSLGLTLVSMVLLARFLKPYDYGILNLGMAIMLFSYLFVDLGIGYSAVYFIPKKINEAKFLRLLAKWRAIATIIVSGLLIMLSDVISNFYHVSELSWILKLFALALVFYSIDFLVQSIIQGYQRFKLFMISDVALGLTKYLPIILVLFGLGIFGATLGFVVTYGISALITTLLFYGFIRVSKEGSAPNTNAIKNYAMFGFLIFVFYTLYNFATNLIVGYFLPADAVGFFTISWQAGNYSILAVPVAIGAVLWPVLSEMHFKKEDLNESFRRITKYMFYISTPAAIGLIVLSERTISFIFGAEYVYAAPLLSIMGLGFLLQGCSAGIDNLVLGIGKPKLMTYKNGIQAALNVILCIILIPVLGLIGTGISFVIVSIIGAILINYWALKEYGFRYPFKALIKSLFAALIMALTLKFFYNDLRFIPLIIIGAIVYFALLILLRGFDRKDLETMGLEKYWVLLKSKVIKNR